MFSFGPFYNPVEGAVVIGFDTFNLISDSTVFCIYNYSGSQAEQIDVRSVGSVALRARVRSSNASSCDLNPGAFSPGDILKLAFGFKANNFYASLNYSNPAPDPLGAMPTVPLDTIRFAVRGPLGPTPTYYFIGHIRSFAYYNVRPTDAQLRELAKT
jgi:hypothetical protein